MPKITHHHFLPETHISLLHNLLTWTFALKIDKHKHSSFLFQVRYKTCKNLLALILSLSPIFSSRQLEGKDLFILVILPCVEQKVACVFSLTSLLFIESEGYKKACLSCAFFPASCFIISSIRCVVYWININNVLNVFCTQKFCSLWRISYFSSFLVAFDEKGTKRLPNDDL